MGVREVYSPLSDDLLLTVSPVLFSLKLHIVLLHACIAEHVGDRSKMSVPVQWVLLTYLCSASSLSYCSFILSALLLFSSTCKRDIQHSSKGLQLNASPGLAVLQHGWSVHLSASVSLLLFAPTLLPFLSAVSPSAELTLPVWGTD